MVNRFNGKDFKTIFCVTVLSGGVDDFIPFPERKDSLSHDFAEENGMDIDLSDPKFKARKFRLKCVIEAVGATYQLAIAQFWNLRNALFTEISALGVHDLYIGSLDKTFKVYYLNEQNVVKAGFQNDRVVVSFDLVFGETDPTVNIPKVYLVDHLDRFLIA